ncbi:Gfo/Idh/MocA family oxidoreductase [bacterium]|nr:Gfo/Idh/MocA family oxidoreductase [bacterium]
MPKSQINVALVGARFAGSFHMEAYRRVHGVRVEVLGVASKDPARARAFAERQGIPKAYAALDELFADPDIDVVDLCVPNLLHKPLIIRAVQAGKDVICEKPLTGYYGPPDAGEGDLIGRRIKNQAMLDAVMGEVAELEKVLTQTGKRLFYGENWVYAPPIQKARRLLSAAEGTIMRMTGEESHSGSHASYSYQWRTAGGGALLGKGCHPLGAALYLKQDEGLRKFGRPIRPVSVSAEVAQLTHMKEFEKEKRHYMRTGWQDVEDWGSMLVTFQDGSVAQITASDTVLGGVHNHLDVYASNARIHCNINPVDAIVAYAPEPGIFKDEYIVEKIETNGGWTFPSPDEDWITGYYHELQDFIECAADPDRQPLSGWQVARDCVAVIYAAYVSAEEGSRVKVP